MVLLSMKINRKESTVRVNSAVYDRRDTECREKRKKSYIYRSDAAHITEEERNPIAPMNPNNPIGPTEARRQQARNAESYGSDPTDRRREGMKREWAPTCSIIVPDV